MSLRLLTLVTGTILLCGAICNAQSPAPTPQTQPVSKSTPESHKVVIVLARGAGYWDMAPVYRLTIYHDGSVAYIGSKNVKTKGLAKGRISREEVQRLVGEFEKINYFSLLEEYSDKGGCPFFLWDGANASTSISYGGKNKAVFHDSGCYENDKMTQYFPRGLTELENLIDEIVKSGQWIK
jgi:hypothetical protein